MVHVIEGRTQRLCLRLTTLLQLMCPYVGFIIELKGTYFDLTSLRALPLLGTDSPSAQYWINQAVPEIIIAS